MSDLIKNIKRIAETEELKRLIEQLLNQDGELAERGTIGKSSYTAYNDSTGAINGKGGEGPQTDPGTSSPTDGNTDDAISENDGLKDKDGDELSDGDIGIGDKMDRITDLEDCSTGEKLEIITTDNYIPPNIDGLEGYTHQDWVDGEDPREDQWRSGVWYQVAAATKSTSAWGALNNYLPTLDSADPPNAPHSISSIADYDVDTTPDASNIVGVVARNTPPVGDPTVNVNITINKTGCTIGVDAWCPTSRPINDFPADGIHQVKFDGARFVTSPYEPLADQHGPWQNSPSKITACTAAGDQITFQGANDGTLLATVDTGTASGNTYKINNKGIVTDIFTSSVSHLLPKGT